MSRERALVLWCTVFLVACGGGGGEQPPPADTTAIAPAEPPPAAAATGVAGRWNMRIMAQTGDSAVAEYVLAATDSDTGWTMTFPNRDPIPVRVLVNTPDSVVTEAGPYPSVLRDSVAVRTHSVMRVQGDTLHAQTVARYETTGADSVMNVHSLGTRAP